MFGQICAPLGCLLQLQCAGALGFVVFRSTTLGVTLTLTLGSKHSLGLGLVPRKKPWRQLCCGSFSL